MNPGPEATPSPWCHCHPDSRLAQLPSPSTLDAVFPHSTHRLSSNMLCNEFAYGAIFSLPALKRQLHTRLSTSAAPCLEGQTHSVAQRVCGEWMQVLAPSWFCIRFSLFVSPPAVCLPLCGVLGPGGERFGSCSLWGSRPRRG